MTISSLLMKEPNVRQNILTIKNFRFSTKPFSFFLSTKIEADEKFFCFAGKKLRHNNKKIISELQTCKNKKKSQMQTHERKKIFADTKHQIRMQAIFMNYTDNYHTRTWAPRCTEKHKDIDALTRHSRTH